MKKAEGERKMIDFEAAAVLRKWPSLGGERRGPKRFRIMRDRCRSVWRHRMGPNCNDRLNRQPTALHPLLLLRDAAIRVVAEMPHTSTTFLETPGKLRKASVDVLLSFSAALA